MRRLTRQITEKGCDHACHALSIRISLFHLCALFWSHRALSPRARGHAALVPGMRAKVRWPAWAPRPRGLLSLNWARAPKQNTRARNLLSRMRPYYRARAPRQLHRNTELKTPCLRMAGLRALLPHEAAGRPAHDPHAGRWTPPPPCAAHARGCTYSYCTFSCG